MNAKKKAQDSQLDLLAAFQQLYCYDSNLLGVLVALGVLVTATTPRGPPSVNKLFPSGLLLSDVLDLTSPNFGSKVSAM